MRLVYETHKDPTKVGAEVQVGDQVNLWSQKGPHTGALVRVEFFRPPHKPASSGHVTVAEGKQRSEVYVSIIGAVWIEREDR